MPSRAERKCLAELRAEGYTTMYAADDPPCLFDVLAWNQDCARYIQVRPSKKHRDPTSVGLAQIKAVEVPKNCAKELWIYPTLEGAPKKVRVK